MLKDIISKVDKFMQDLGSSVSDSVSNATEQLNTGANRGIDEIVDTVNQAIQTNENKGNLGTGVAQNTFPISEEVKGKGVGVTLAKDNFNGVVLEKQSNLVAEVGSEAGKASEGATLKVDLNK